MTVKTLQLFSIRDFSIKVVEGFIYDGECQPEIALTLNVSHAPEYGDLVRDIETGAVYEVERFRCEPVIGLNSKVCLYNNITLYVNTRIKPKEE